MELDKQLLTAFGFAVSLNRNKGHLGYSDSWDLGDSYSIVATGGKNQGDTCLVSLNGSGCMPIKDWQAVYDLLITLNAKITRVDLAHDDFAGVYNIVAGLEMLALGQFNTNGRPPNAQYIDDFDSGKGKTLYIGNRDNGKLLRIYEKGKQLGDPSQKPLGTLGTGTAQQRPIHSIGCITVPWRLSGGQLSVFDLDF
jgi:phage replication initiation protein